MKSLRQLFCCLLFSFGYQSFLKHGVRSQNFPFRDVKLPWDTRVDDLIYRLTPQEVIDQLSHGGASNLSNPTPAIQRLGIGPYTFDTECLRGAFGKSTAFPQAITLASTFSYDLMYAVAEAVGVEVRALNNNFTAHHDYGVHKGLSCFSPVINIMRHPTWGRNQETYGEDPHLSGQLASAYVKGLQGDHPRYVRASAGCKHFNVHGGPENIPSSRFYFDSKVSEHDWRQTFLPQFRECVRAGTYSVMCSYNSINGVPACANSKLLQTILRDEWGFKGYVVSDEEAIRNVQNCFKYTKSVVDTAATCLKAGCNLELSGPWLLPTGPVYDNLTQALSQGLIDKDLLYERVRPLFYTRMRLGEFDPPDMNPYRRLTPQDWIQSPQHKELATVAAAKAIIMLKNRDFLLPIQEPDNVALVGPFANNASEIYGDYAPDFDAKEAVSPLAGMRKSTMFQSISYAAGCSAPDCADYDIRSVLTAVRGVGLVFVCLGTGSYEHEGKDRPNMTLPGSQTQLLLDIIDFAGPQAQIVLLLFSAGPVSLPGEAWEGARSVLQVGFPAQAAGDALTRVLTGKENPGGRLPYTWYASLDDVPDMTNYTMVGRTYRYTRAAPLFPFGYGLSFASFTYSNMSVTPSQLSTGDEVTVSVTLSNSMLRDGDEVTQVYISWPRPFPTPSTPIRQLVGFNRVFLKKGESTRLAWTVTSEQMELWNDGGYMYVPPGMYTAYAGGQQPDQKTKVPSNVVSAKFTVTNP